MSVASGSPNSAAEQVERYRIDGFVVIENVLSTVHLQQARQITEELVQRSGSVKASNDVFDLEPEHSSERPMLRRIKSPARLHPFFDQLIRSDAILDRLEPLIGQGIRLLGSKLNMKAADGGSAVEWHQDFAFHPHTNEDVFALGIYLDDATVDNGCMLMVRGSHVRGVLDHHQDGVFIGAISPSHRELDLTQAVAVEVKAGGISVHHGLMVHGSAPNTSGRPRRLLLYDLAGVDAWPLMGVADLVAYNQQILRGEPTVRVRLSQGVARIPLPQPAAAGSIFEIQTGVREKAFTPSSGRKTPPWLQPR